MKIVIIHGQSHTGSTCNIARILAKKLEGDVVEFFLPKDFGEYCIGCNNCFSKSETLCPHAPKLKPITEALDCADVIILASPVYVYHASGPMKGFLDHYGYRWMVHRPEESMFKKQGVCISTAAGGGTKSTNKDMADSLFFWGVGKVYKYGQNVRATNFDNVSEKIKQKIEQETEILARKIKNNHGHVKPSFKSKLFFEFMKIMQKRGWNEADVNYWREKNWDKGKKPWK